MTTTVRKNKKPFLKNRKHIYVDGDQAIRLKEIALKQCTTYTNLIRYILQKAIDEQDKINVFKT